MKRNYNSSKKELNEQILPQRKELNQEIQEIIFSSNRHFKREMMTMKIGTLMRKYNDAFSKDLSTQIKQVRSSNSHHASKGVFSTQEKLKMIYIYLKQVDDFEVKKASTYEGSFVKLSEKAPPYNFVEKSIGNRAETPMCVPDTYEAMLEGVLNRKRFQPQPIVNAEDCDQLFKAIVALLSRRDLDLNSEARRVYVQEIFPLLQAMKEDGKWQQLGMLFLQIGYSTSLESFLSKCSTVKKHLEFQNISEIFKKKQEKPPLLELVKEFISKSQEANLWYLRNLCGNFEAVNPDDILFADGLGLDSRGFPIKQLRGTISLKTVLINSYFLTNICDCYANLTRFHRGHFPRNPKEKFSEKTEPGVFFNQLRRGLFQLSILNMCLCIIHESCHLNIIGGANSFRNEHTPERIKKILTEAIKGKPPGKQDYVLIDSYFAKRAYNAKTLEGRKLQSGCLWERIIFNGVRPAFDKLFDEWSMYYRNEHRRKPDYRLLDFINKLYFAWKNGQHFTLEDGVIQGLLKTDYCREDSKRFDDNLEGVTIIDH